MRTSRFYRALTAAALIALVAAVLAARISAAGVSAYVQHDLVSDGFLPADHVDPNLVNAWGLTAQPASPWWVADNGTDVSTNGRRHPEAARRLGAERSDGRGLEHGIELRRREWTRAVPVRDRGREDPWVERGARHDGCKSPSTARATTPSSRGSQSPVTACTRPISTMDRSTSS